MKYLYQNIWVAPWFSQNWSPTSGCQQTFEEMMVGLAGQSGHPELTKVPIVPFGHSAQATKTHKRIVQPIRIKL